MGQVQVQEDLGVVHRDTCGFMAMALDHLSKALARLTYPGHLQPQVSGEDDRVPAFALVGRVSNGCAMHQMGVQHLPD